MRDRRGGPRTALRLLALVVALLLGGPVTIYALRMITSLLSHAI